MLQLIEHNAKLSSVNPRAELHGDQPEPAIDLMIEAACPSTVLNSFHPELRSMLYKKDENPGRADGRRRCNDCAAHAEAGRPKMGHAGSGYTVTVDYGMGGDRNIVVGDVKVDKFKFTAEEGGTVTGQCRTIAHPNEKVIRPLCSFIQRDIIISVPPPEAIIAQDLFNEAT